MKRRTKSPKAKRKALGNVSPKGGDARFTREFAPVLSGKRLFAPTNLNGGERQEDLGYAPNGPTAATADTPDRVLREPMKTESSVTPQRVQQFLLSRFNPIKGLSPRLMTSYLEQWDYGFVRQMALVWSKIKERDDQVASVTEAREVKPADMAWEIQPDDESPEAAEHKTALEEFYKGLSVQHALDLNQRGSVQLLLKMMMKAVGDKFAAFEIIWRPNPEGGLTADLKYLPLWFFENRTGQLRFLPYELAYSGIPLTPGGWMVHVGKGLFAATSIVYLYKQMGLKTWVTYQEKFGIPFLHAKTNADYNSEEWAGLLTAITNFSSDGGLVTKMQTEIEAISGASAGTMPHEPFCDRMDRAIARIWRGGDLSTMSQGGGASSDGGVGSLPQMENESALAKTDAEQLSETCQFYLDRWVIKYRFGDDVVPKAKFMLQPPQQVDANRELMIDKFLLSVGVPLAVSDLYERYGRNLPDEGDALAQAPAARAFGEGGGGAGGPPDGAAQPPKPGDEDKDASKAPLENIAPAPGMKRFVRTAASMQAQALAKSLAPLRARLVEIANMTDKGEQNIALEAVRRSLPEYVKRGVSHELVNVIADSLSTAAVIGATDGSAATGHLHTRRQHLNGHAIHQ